MERPKPIRLGPLIIGAEGSTVYVARFPSAWNAPTEGDLVLGWKFLWENDGWVLIETHCRKDGDLHIETVPRAV